MSILDIQENIIVNLNKSYKIWYGQRLDCLHTIPIQSDLVEIILEPHRYPANFYQSLLKFNQFYSYTVKQLNSFSFKFTDGRP